MKKIFLFTATALFCCGGLLFAKNTLTLPLPLKDGLCPKEMTLTVCIPEKVKPLQRKVRKKKRLFPYWDRHPTPTIDTKDEVYEILRNFSKQKLIRQRIVNKLLRERRPLEKYFLVNGIQDVILNLWKFKNSDDYKRHLRKSKLRATDIDDLLRLFDRYEKELQQRGIHIKKTRKMMATVMADLKDLRAGIVKVVRVEQNKKGCAVLHLVIE
ncbi:hypothetical protein ACFL35_02735 [Candidatus Riflebacteria bacterium]